MKKTGCLLLCLLLGLVGIIGLAGCGGGDGGDKQGSLLLEELRIGQGDIDRTLKNLQYSDPEATAEQAMIVELTRRTLLLEAERQELLPDKEAARQRVLDNYEGMRQSAAEPEENVRGAQEAWDYLQGFIRHMGLTEAEYLEMAAESVWITEAGQAVREAFVATLTPEQQADEWEVMLAWEPHQNELLLELGPQLLTDEVRELGEAFLARIEAEQAVFEESNARK